MSPILLLSACDHDAPSQAPAPSTPSDPCAAAVVLNDLAPSNRDVLTDPEGDSVDWLELANAGDTAVDLSGWTLSDDADEPWKWTFPPVVLEPGGLLVVYASGKGIARPVASWDTPVDLGHVWRYLPVDGPIDGWTLPGFDDSEWPTGPSGFGRGDGDDATVVGTSTVYVRTTFELATADAADLVGLVLHVDYDDGFVAWLDGVDLARANVGGSPPAWDAFATTDHEARIPLGDAPEAFDLAGVLPTPTAGTHTLAVEVHDASADSSDLSLVPILTLGFSTAREGQASSLVDLAPVGLHTNFELKAEGERVRLFDPAGCLADEAEPDALLADQTFGRQPDGTGPWLYFLEPTPGMPNTPEGRVAFADAPVLDPPGGFFPGGTEVQVLAEPWQRVHVATDGREPTESDPEVTGPLSATTGEAVVLRVRAFEDGLWPSRTTTATVLLRDPGALPVVSLVTDPANLWDDETGILAFGTSYEPELPYYGANFWQDWERPIHAEMWEPDATRAFGVSAGVSVHGGWTRAHEQKSLVLDLDPGWGDDEIEYPVFPDLPFDAYDRLLLRAAGNDWLGCFAAGCSEGANLRDALAHRLVAGADLDAMAYRPAEVYLNGVWWGISELREKPDLSYVVQHHGVEDVDLLELDGRVVEGDAVAWEALLHLLRTGDLSDPAVWAEVEAQVDIDELATYLAVEVFLDNTDWPGNNIKYWRPRAEGGRWRWMLYDTDFGLGADGADPEHDTLAFALAPDGASWPNPPWSTELFRLMVTSPAFALRFANLYADHLNTTFDPYNTRATLAEVAADLEADIPRHAERWGSWTDGVETHTLDPGVWEPEVDRIDTWLKDRPEHVRAHVVTNLGLPGTFPLTLDTDPPSAATFRLAAVEVEGPFEGEYFQGVPVTVTAVPIAGRAFVGWSDPTLPAEPTVTFTATSDAPVALVALFE